MVQGLPAAGVRAHVEEPPQLLRERGGRRQVLAGYAGAYFSKTRLESDHFLQTVLRRDGAGERGAEAHGVKTLRYEYRNF